MTSKSRLYSLSSLIFLLVFSLAFCVCEFWVRYFQLRNVDETRDHVIQTPYMPVKLKGNFRGRIWNRSFATNQYGFRGEPDFGRTPPRNEFRILSLGDSIGFGLGIEPSDHYTKVLERNLNEQAAGVRFRVINAGGQGYSPSCYYVYLKHEGLQFQPRTVIVEIELSNDITDEALLGWEAEAGKTAAPEKLRGGRYIVGWDGNLLATYSFGPYFFEKTYTHTVLLRRLLNLLYKIHPVEPFHSRPGVTYYSLGFDRYLLSEERIESGWKKMFLALKATRELAAQRNIAFLLLIVPGRYIFEEDSGAYGRFAQQLVERSVKWAGSHGIPCLDLTAAIQTGGGAQLYFDFAHLTAEGNAVIGDEVAEYLLSELKGLGPNR